MTIYAVGGESEIFGTPEWTSNHDSSYSRISGRPPADGHVGFGLRTAFGGNSETGWWFRVRAVIQPDLSGSTSYADNDLLRALSPEGDEIFRLDVENGDIIGAYLTSSTGTSASQTISVGLPGASFFDVHCYTETGSSKLDVYKDEALIASVTASGANAALGSVLFVQPDKYYYGGTASFSEFVAADEDTRGMRVKTVVPTGDDSTHNWNGSYSAIDEYDDTADGISSNTSGQTALFTHANALALSNIHSFVIASRVAAGTSNGAQGLIRLSSTNYETPFSYPLTTGEQTNFAVFSTNPATGLPFTAADLNSMAFGIKSGSPA